MGTFEVIEKFGDHEQVVFCHNKDVGLKAIIAIHNTGLGPALGGSRMWPYKSEEEALIDVLRLSKGMTYKNAAAGLNLGGGKAVIIGDPKIHKTEALFRAFGAFVNTLSGRYITAEDVGTNVRDMENVFMETPWVAGIPTAYGGSGDPSPHTAHGVLMGIKASVKHRLGLDSLENLKIAVQGLGSVGSHLIKYLHQEKARVLVADIDRDRVQKMVSLYNATPLDPVEIITSECDVLAPCAMGAVINDQTVQKLRCKIVAGGANNQLAEIRHGALLREAGILYAPDYVINAGGVMNVFVELEGYTVDRAVEKTTGVYENCMRVFQISDSQNIPTNVAADRMAEERIRTISQLRTQFQGHAARPFTTLRELNKR